ncbi:MAG: UDP-N-acetylmuramate dehydrogenase [Mogibacterium sp.]|nr:UDP-N-acetylmuramate dehydrogenase [Mogibacterium sp.]
MILKEETNRAIEKIAEVLPAERLTADEPMSRHTSFRIGGPAACLAVISNEDELSAVLRIVNEEGAEYMLVGNGSNLLVSDEGYPGIAIKLGGDFDSIFADENDDTLVHVGAAKLMSSTSAFLTEHGLAGFEFASGIPGSIGGAVFMNAGAYGGEIKDIAESVRAMSLDKCEILDLTNEDMDFGYRSSRAQKGDIVILSAVFRLSKDEPAEIADRVSELAAKRNSKQPVNFPSAGSTFKRPVGGFAAALIEEAGLKGYRVGGAAVSEKHSGFVINEGGATCEDVLAVMRHVRETVYEKSGIMLEPEVRLINCEL